MESPENYDQEQEVLGSSECLQLNGIKFGVHFISLRRPGPPIKLWLQNLELLGPFKNELLLKYKDYIERVSLCDNMKEFYDNRLRIINEAFKIAGVPVKTSSSSQNIDLDVEHSRKSQDNFRSSSNIAEADITMARSNEQNMIEKPFKNIPSIKIRRARQKRKTLIENPLEKPETVIANIFCDESHVHKIANLKEKPRGLKRRKRSTFTRNTDIVREIPPGEEVTKDRPDSKEVDDKLRLLIGTELVEIIKEIKSKYQNQELIDSEVAYNEFEHINSILLSILGEYDKLDN